jgi:hypothetical protein
MDKTPSPNLSKSLTSSLTTSQCQTHEPPEPPLHIRISIFFDGTGNNMYNTRSREQGMAEGETGSFLNDFSNVARLCTTLHTPSDGEDHHLVHYVEGIGTLADSSDDWIGMGLGQGGRGVKDRSSDCLDHIVSQIQGLAAGHKKLDRLRIDGFGFSRGSAAARYFTHLMLDKSAGIKAQVSKFIPVVLFEIPFLGLFDTVASFGGDHTNDTADLNLDAIKDATVKKVVQLAAGDEHRLNFPLTNIASAGSRGQEIFLPGVHSDVGGGYTNLSSGGSIEEDLVLFEATGMPDDAALVKRCNAMRQELIDLGWFHENEVKISSDYIPAGGGLILEKRKVVGTRYGISKKYSYVPLHIMANKAGSKGLTFTLTKYKYSDLPLLVAIRSLVDDNAHNGPYWLSNKDPNILALRHRFMHSSSNYETTMGMATGKPQFYSAAEGFADSHTNLMTGQRRRQIFAG